MGLTQIDSTQLSTLPVVPDAGPQQERNDHEGAEEGPDHDALVPVVVRRPRGRRSQGAARPALLGLDGGDVVGVDVDGDNVGELSLVAPLVEGDQTDKVVPGIRDVYSFLESVLGVGIGSSVETAPNDSILT